MGAAAALIDGKAIAARIEGELAAEVARLRAAGVTPRLDVVGFEGDGAFASYAKGRADACRRVGVASEQHTLAPAAGEAAAIRTLRALGADPAVDGVLLQAPLPDGFDALRVLAALDPAKDVEGVHPESLGLLYLGTPRFIPCTPAAVVRILDEHEIETAGRHVVIVGRSAVVGRALALLFLRKHPRGDATVTVCHSRTRDLAAHTVRADILVTATGDPQSIRGEHVRPGAVAIDVGTSAVPDPSAKRGYRIVGDLDFASVSAVASLVTPVPGGVGPVTVALLLANAVSAARRRHEGVAA